MNNFLKDIAINDRIWQPDLFSAEENKSVSLNSMRIWYKTQGSGFTNLIFLAAILLLHVFWLSPTPNMEQFATWLRVSAPQEQEQIKFDASQYEFFGKNVAEHGLEDFVESMHDAPADETGTGQLNRMSRPVSLGYGTERASAPMETRFVMALPQHGRKTGSVKWFSNQRGYGFIAPSDGSKDVFVHYSSLKSDGCVHLQPNTSVEYEIIRDSEGKTQAINVTAPGGRLLQDSRKLGPGELTITGSSSSSCSRRSMSFLSSNSSSFNNVGPCFICGQLGHRAKNCYLVARGGAWP